MFVRKKKNPSGIISVQVIDKTNGNYKVVKTIGSSSDLDEVDYLYTKGIKWIKDNCIGPDIFEQNLRELEEKHVTNNLISNIENILINGTQLILERAYRSVGFDKINDNILKNLVISRLSQPMSKSATVDYLKAHFDEDLKLHTIYRYLDKLYNTQQEKVQQISVEHTMKILGGKIGMMFYDVTTLYFETDNSDELRETGFSKDGKHSQPQIVLGLLVSRNGYPLSYSIFNGSQYEGRTMIPIVDSFIHKFQLKDFVIVADSGLMNKSNITLLESAGYKYIIGARIKNEKDEIKQWILSQNMQDGNIVEREKDFSRIIVSYSESRAKKDKHNRDKGVKRLQKAYKSGNITKENINNRGYNKFLEISDDVKVSLNQQKIREDEKWDGLKGYITNTLLSAKEVIEQYNGLWVIERAFRVTKGTIELRPMFHFTARRIEAHVCICFVAYMVYKELERRLKNNGSDLSVDAVLKIAKTITTIKLKLPVSGSQVSRTMMLTPKQKSIKFLFEDHFFQSL